MRTVLRVAGPLGVLVLLSALMACSAPGAQPGTLSGQLVGAGGPPPGLARPFPGVVTVTGPGFSQQMQVGNDGRFSLTLAPGQYTATATSPNLTSNGLLATCYAPRQADVTAGSTTTLDVVCSLD